MSNDYKHSAQHFLDTAMRDAQRFREVMPALVFLLKTLDVDLYGDSPYNLFSQRFGNYESNSLVACLEWITRAIENEKRIEKEMDKLRAKLP